MSKEEHIEVTLKIPKPMVDLFKAAQQFAKNTSLSLEEWLYDRIMFGFREDIRDLNPGP